MAARPISRALRSPLSRNLSTTASSVSRRSFISAASAAARPCLVAAPRAAVSTPVSQQIRGVKTIDFAGSKEEVYGVFLFYSQFFFFFLFPLLVVIFAIKLMI